MESVVDCGAGGDCGFLSIIASLINQAAPPLLWEDEVQAMRELIGSYWDLKDPPTPLDPFLNIEQDPMFPKEDIRGRGVYMQDRDLIFLIHLMDLKGVRVNDQLFTQDVVWGSLIRERLHTHVLEFWGVAWALKNTKKIVHLYHNDLHFMAFLEGGRGMHRHHITPPHNRSIANTTIAAASQGGGGDYYY
jgi:hypothetical protein